VNSTDKRDKDVGSFTCDNVIGPNPKTSKPVMINTKTAGMPVMKLRKKIIIGGTLAN